MYKALKLTEGQGFDWVVAHNESILTGHDGRPARYDSESAANSVVRAKNAEESATDVEKLVADRLQAVCPTPFGRLVFLRMAKAAVKAITERNERAIHASTVGRDG